MSIKFYHGTKNSSQFQVAKTFKRYPFFYLFGATNKELAANYAHCYSKTQNNIITFEVKKIDKVIDWNYQSTYTNAFHNLILSFQNTKKTVLIKNCFDKPTSDYDAVISDIIAVFDANNIII